MRARSSPQHSAATRFAVWPLAVLLLAWAAAPAAAQGSGEPRVEVLLPAGPGQALPVAAEGGPRVVTANILAGAELRELIRSGFPAQLRYRLELWREGGWFDDLEGATEWIAIVAYDPAVQLYRVRRRAGSQTEDLGAFVTLASAQSALERPIRVPLVPRRTGRRYYYNLSVDVEALSVSDLDELERWLRGEVRPAVRGRNNPVNVVRSLITRVLGGERRHYERRSGRFRAG